ncbi:MAG: hypothetical protein ACRCUY_01675, partial [Thermoguttaceae bacterium]
VKTTLRVAHVRHFLANLKHVKEWMPEYSDKKVLGAVAFLREADDSSTFAAKKGLFTILATGSSAAITNQLDFKPREF